jgi:hypothetical protein
MDIPFSEILSLYVNGHSGFRPIAGAIFREQALSDVRDGYPLIRSLSQRFFEKLHAAMIQRP